MRQIGTRRADLDPTTRAYVDLLARLLAKIEIADAYIEEHGLIRDDGEPQPVLRLYVSLVNSARLTLAKLEDRLRLSERLPLDDFLEGIARESDGS